MSVRPIPEGYHTVTPYLIVNGADRLIEFLKQAFGAKERGRMDDGNGKVAHAEVQIGDSVVMISDATEQWPQSTATLHLYVDDCDGTYRRALEAGGTSVQEPADQFYGDRSGGVRDASGNVWWLATHVEDVRPEELEKRAQEWQARA